MTPVSRLLPYLAALLVGVTIGGIADSPVLAAIVACGVSVAWALYSSGT